MGVRRPTAFSRGRRRRRTRLGSRSARRRKTFGRNKILKNEIRETTLAIQQARRNEILLNGHLKKVGEELLPTPPEKLYTTLEKKQEKITPVVGILAWFGKLFSKRQNWI